MQGSHPIVFYAAIALAAFLAGVSKGGLGGIMGSVIAPMLALVMPLNVAIGLLLPILIFADLFALAVYWRRWETRLMGVLLAGGVVGVTLGTVVLTNVSPIVVRKGLGVIVLIFVAYRLFEDRILSALDYRPRRWHGLLAGSAAGFTSTLAHAGDPPIAIYLLLQNLPPAVFVATMVLFFALINWIKVPYYLYAGLLDFSTLPRLIWFAPFVPLGVWVGKRLVTRADKMVFQRIIVVLLLVTGILLLVE